MASLTVNDVLTQFNISRAVLKRMVDDGLDYSESNSRERVFDDKEIKEFIEKKRRRIESQLEVKREYTNENISEMFECNKQRGMKKSNALNALILLAKHDTTNSYKDYWDKNGVFYYTGMGVKGDQRLDYYENKTLNDSNRNGVSVYLFERFVNHEFIYRGIVKLVDQPFQQEERDYEGNKRKVWKFPLKLIKQENYIDLSVIDEQQNQIEKTAKRLTKENLIKKAKEASKYGNISIRTVLTKSYERNEYIKEYALERANGECELCGAKGPFIINGRPYLESHHIVWLSRGGADDITNVAAVCPNCHRKLHKLDLKEDRNHLMDKINEDEGIMNVMK